MNKLTLFATGTLTALSLGYPATVLSHQGQHCHEADGRTFEKVAEKAAISCNNKGYWEASFGKLHKYIYVPAGTFTMGSNEGLEHEKPVHEVELDGYWIAKYPVTVSQFRQFITETGYVTDAEQGHGSWQWNGEKPGYFSSLFPLLGGDPWEPMSDGRWNNIYFDQTDDDPVGSVSWNDANYYAAWLSARTGIEFALPTEAQWEKAARGTDGRRFPWGNTAPTSKQANLADSRFVSKYGQYTRRSHSDLDDGYVETSPVDAFPAGQSPYGAYDLAGNLGEWVYDAIDHDYYQQSPTKNPTGPTVSPDTPAEQVERVNRGGSWVDWSGIDEDGNVSPEGGHNIRSSARTGDEQTSSDDHMGFRLAIDPERSAEVDAQKADELIDTSPLDPYMPDLTGVEILTHKAAGQVYMLEATGDVAGNIAVSVGPDGILMVDDQYRQLAADIETALKNLHKGDLRYIVNTHHHADHSDGNAYLSKSGAIIVSHERARQRLLDKEPGHWPNITFDDELFIYFNNERIKLISIPGGHTDNDIVVYFESSNVAHLGDLMNSGTSSFPIADFSAGGNALTIQKNVSTLIDIIPDGATIIPGHGPLTKKSELYQLQTMLDETISHVKALKEQGLSEEEIIAKGLPEQYSEWGYGYTNAEDWIRTILYSLENMPQ